ncbi:hypothetical protein LSAT2_029553, partial [Lamellibrachia satsuma]
MTRYIEKLTTKRAGPIRREHGHIRKPIDDDRNHSGTESGEREPSFNLTQFAVNSRSRSGKHRKAGRSISALTQSYHPALTRGKFGV